MMSCSILIGLALLGTAPFVSASPDPTASTPISPATAGMPAGSYPYMPAIVPPPPLKDSKWNIRVEILMVAVPLNQFFHLLPELEDPQKIDGAVGAILAAIQRKEAILTGYPIVNLLDGQRATSETILEKLYPSEFIPPQVPQNMGTAAASGNTGTPADVSATPTSWEKRNLGVSLEVTDASVSETGETIYLSLQPKRVDVGSTDTYQVTRTLTGRNVTVYQPQFVVTEQTTALAVKNSRYFLLSTHLLSKPENHMEIFIIRAFATPIRESGKS